MKRNKLIHSFNNIIGKKPQRSKFNRCNKHVTTMNTGDLIPIYFDEVLPNDTFDITTKAVVRQTSLIKPVMDALYLDIMYFFVPNRLVWENWKKFMGENTDAWAVTTPETIPQTTAPATTGWTSGTIADYLGIPLGKTGISVSSLPFRAITLIVNEWFRNENLQNSAHITLDSSTTTGTNGGTYTTDLEGGGLPFKAGKYPDYFTECLPAPQKGAPITINVGGQAPVLTQAEVISPSGEPMVLSNSSGGSSAKLLGVNESSQAVITNTLDTAGGSQLQAVPINLFADLSQATGITINELRQAITFQQMLEQDARGGTRYVEFIKSHFGIDSPDARQQRPEYLGGLHEPLNVQQVPQTAPTTTTDTPQANLAAFSQTNLTHKSFKKTFTEHGYVIGLAVVRYPHTYQQGTEKTLSRKTKNEFFDPIFANIGEQPVYNKEIYTQGNSTDDEIFGFQEAWADYRYKPNKVTGKMRSGTDSLDVWHYADNYTTLPTLSPTWFQEDPTNVDRTLAIKSTGENAEPQFQIDTYFENKCERPMPTYSIPGLKKL